MASDMSKIRSRCVHVASPTKALLDQDEANWPSATLARVMDTKMKRNTQYSRKRLSMPAYYGGRREKGSQAGRGARLVSRGHGASYYIFLFFDVPSWHVDVPVIQYMMEAMSTGPQLSTRLDMKRAAT
jgi:hypothetical protein